MKRTSNDKSSAGRPFLGPRGAPPHAHERTESNLPIAATHASSNAQPIAHAHATATPAVSVARLVVQRVTCAKTTREVGADEIVLTAVETVAVVTASGGKSVATKSRRGKTVSAGKFSKGDSRAFESKRVVAELPLGNSRGEWPRTLLVTLLLVEEDEGKIGKLVSAVIDAVDERVESAIKNAAGGVATGIAAAALAGSAAGSVVPLIGTAVGAAASAAAATALGVLKNARHDDAFGPEIARLELHAAPKRAGEVANSRSVVHFHGNGGDYSVAYAWEVA